MTRTFLRFSNGLLTFVVTVVLVISAAYAGYALWDNQQVYDAAENVLDEMKAIRAQMENPKTQKGIAAFIASLPTATPRPTSAPTDAPTAAPVPTPPLAQAAPAEVAANLPEHAPTSIPSAPTAVPDAVTVAAAIPAPTNAPQPQPTEEPEDDSLFGQLKAINPDVTAWITMPGTAIDYPVLQGSSNYSYLNTDVYGNFALAGSIFLDSRNDSTYQDTYSLLYGHDMSQHRMFSDLNLYKDEEFFNENHLGLLMTPQGAHILQSLSCIVTSAGNSGLFNTDNWKHFTTEQMIQTAKEDALYVSEEGFAALQAKIDAGEEFRIVALSTCTGEFTDARTILLTLMDP